LFLDAITLAKNANKSDLHFLKLGRDTVPRAGSGKKLPKTANRRGGRNNGG
jgi:hypothetical protein